MLRVLSVPRGGRVLEVGCGRGIALAPLARRLVPARLAGVDVDAGLLELASDRIRASAVRAEMVAADVCKLPFADGDFDVVIDFGTCYHIARPDAALHEVARVLAPGGMFVTEMKLSQILSHPIRSAGRSLPWHVVPSLIPLRRALLWESRRRISA